MNIAQEKWETITEFPNYMISSESRVLNKTTLKMVSVSIHQHMFRVVRLWKNNTSRLFKIYRLKAIHFIPNPNNKKFVNHIDGNRLNEDLDNLEWATASENMKHAFAAGLSKGNFKKGAGGFKLGSPERKLTNDDVLLLRRWYKSGFYDETKISKVFNVTGPYATRIATRKEACHV